MVMSGCTSAGDATATATPDPETVGFVRAAGRGLEVDGKTIRLKAINFSNFYYENFDGTSLLQSRHHSEQDFRRVKALGFNSIRFAFDGDWFFEDRDAFWKWLDRNVVWARNNDLRLILDLHTPVGGSTSDWSGNEVHFRLWSDAGLQEQTIELWREIARRYQHEQAIAAYDLLNEPVTTDSTGEQWKHLAQRLVDAVRSVDRQHLVVVSELFGIDGRPGSPPATSHFLVDDDNVLYDFHFYKPFRYTHQYASWHKTSTDGGRYPDPDVLVLVDDPLTLQGSRISTDPLPLGTSGWEAYDSGKITVKDRSAVAAIPRFVVQHGMRGKARFGSVTVTEYAPDGTEIRQIVEDKLEKNDRADWYEWESHSRTTFGYQAPQGAPWHRDKDSLAISHISDSEVLMGWANDMHLFKVKPGNQYRIRGYMRGENLAPSSITNPQIRLELEVYAESAWSGRQAFLTRGKAYLKHELTKHLQFGSDHDVPMSILEFGTMRETFDIPGKGGEQWVTDMLALQTEHNLSLGYWEYHGHDMGLYRPMNGPGDPNIRLQEVLRHGLR